MAVWAVGLGFAGAVVEDLVGEDLTTTGSNLVDGDLAIDGSGLTAGSDLTGGDFRVGSGDTAGWTDSRLVELVAGIGEIGSDFASGVAGIGGIGSDFALGVAGIGGIGAIGSRAISTPSSPHAKNMLNGFITVQHFSRRTELI